MGRAAGVRARSAAAATARRDRRRDRRHPPRARAGGAGDIRPASSPPPAPRPVRRGTFAPPAPTRPGAARSARLLRDALRLGFRSSAGPFRSFGQIAVEPRPYQLVPLLMALKLDPVRLLIADDVGIGKTIEAALVAKELLEQGDAHKLAVV